MADKDFERSVWIIILANAIKDYHSLAKISIF